MRSSTIESRPRSKRASSTNSQRSRQGLNEPVGASTYTNFVMNSKVGRYAGRYQRRSVCGQPCSRVPSTSLRPRAYAVTALTRSTSRSRCTSYEDEFRLLRYLGVPVKFQYPRRLRLQHPDGYGIPVAGCGRHNIPADFNGSVYTTIFQTFLGFTAYTSSIKIAKQLSISAKADKLEQWYSLAGITPSRPDVSETLARTPTSVKLPAFLLSYDVLNIGDFYGAQQRYAYPAYPDIITNQFGTFTGLGAFDGFRDSPNALEFVGLYAAHRILPLNLTVSYANVSPRPVPGFSGTAPYTFSADVRVRLSRNVLVDVTRSYYFNFANTCGRRSMGSSSHHDEIARGLRTRSRDRSFGC